MDRKADSSLIGTIRIEGIRINQEDHLVVHLVLKTTQAKILVVIIQVKNNSTIKTKTNQFLKCREKKTRCPI
jgi:hypothetical protein